MHTVLAVTGSEDGDGMLDHWLEIWNLELGGLGTGPQAQLLDCPRL